MYNPIRYSRNTIPIPIKPKFFVPELYRLYGDPELYNASYIIRVINEPQEDVQNNTIFEIWSRYKNAFDTQLDVNSVQDRFVMFGVIDKNQQGARTYWIKTHRLFSPETHSTVNRRILGSQNSIEFNINSIRLFIIPRVETRYPNLLYIRFLCGSKLLNNHYRGCYNRGRSPGK